MTGVLLFFLIPFGCGIPAGVLLGRSRAISWPMMTALYFVSDVIQALYFEPLLRLLTSLGRRSPRLSRALEAYRAAWLRTAAFYGGAGTGPIALIFIAFGVDPMTGRTAAAAAGHGPVSGWALAIAGDMLYFLVIMAATLKLSKLLGNPDLAIAAVMVAMAALPLIAKRWKSPRSDVL